MKHVAVVFLYLYPNSTSGTYFLHFPEPHSVLFRNLPGLILFLCLCAVAGLSGNSEGDNDENRSSTPVGKSERSCANEEKHDSSFGCAVRSLLVKKFSPGSSTQTQIFGSTETESTMVSGLVEAVKTIIMLYLYLAAFSSLYEQFII